MASEDIDKLCLELSTTDLGDKRTWNKAVAAARALSAAEQETLMLRLAVSHVRRATLMAKEAGLGRLALKLLDVVTELPIAEQQWPVKFIADAAGERSFVRQYCLLEAGRRKRTLIWALSAVSPEGKRLLRQSVPDGA